MSNSFDLDAIDRHIVVELQKDARIAIPVLADRVGLSPPACYRRVRRLRASPVILREVAVVDPKRFGWPLAMMVFVVLDREGTRTVEDLMAKFDREPEVHAAWQVTGEYDFVLRIVARSMESYDALVLRLLSEDERIKTFHTHVVIREKHGTPFVPA